MDKTYLCQACANRGTYLCNVCCGSSRFNIKLMSNEAHEKYNSNKIIKEFEKDMAMFDKAVAHSYEDYVRYDLTTTRYILTRISGDVSMVNFETKFEIKDVIFNPPATIVLWKDGTKTVVKEQDGCEFNPWVGMAMACSKKMLGNKGNYFEVFKKYCEPYEEKMEMKSAHKTDLKDLAAAFEEAAKSFAALKIPVIKINMGGIKKKEEEDDIIFTTRSDAENVLEELKNTVRFYGFANLKDLAELADLDDDRYLDNTKGWTSLEKATVRRTKCGWTIDFPRPFDLGGINATGKKEPETDSSDDAMSLEEYKETQRAINDFLNKNRYNPVEEAYMQINNFLNGQGSLDLDEIRGLLGEALDD